MKDDLLSEAKIAWDIEIVSPLPSSYKLLSSHIRLPPWEKVLDYLNNDTPIFAPILTTSYLQECCSYGKLYEGRNVVSLILRPIVTSYIIELTVSEQYSSRQPYKATAFYVKGIQENSLGLLRFLDKFSIDYKILRPSSARSAAILTGGGG